MPAASAILSEFDHEMATTRRLLERVPEGDWDWQPHTKSMTLGQLAAHVGSIPRYGAMIIGHDGFDFAAQGNPESSAEGFTTTAALLDAFDANVRESREALATVGDEPLVQPWTLSNGSTTIFTLPRVAALRTLLLSHIIHHRGQLSVYLRLRDVLLPSIYGPSADEH